MPPIRTKVKKERLEKLLHLPEVESWRALMGAFKFIFGKLEKALLVENCSISRFQILLVLYFEGPLSASEVSRRLLVTRGNISMFLKRLKSDGLIKNETNCQAGRRTLLTLTPKGNKIFESLFPDHINRVRALMPILRPQILNSLNSIFNTSKS